MRKKMLAAAAALVMAAVMATSAFAATNSVILTPPTVGVVGGAEKVSTGEYTNEGGVTVENKSGKEVVEAAKVADKLPSGVSADKLVVAAAFDINGTVTDTVNGARVTVNVDGATKGDTYVMLHYNGTIWEVVGSGAVGPNGAVTGTFKSFSPVIVLTQAATSSGNNSNSSSDKEDNSSSTPAAATQTPAPVLAPQTGVNSAETLAAAVVVAGVAVVAFAAKKIKE